MATAEPTVTLNPPIVARAGRYYRNVRYIMAVAAVALGAWFAYDGFVHWPWMNTEYDRVDAEITRLQNAAPDDSALKPLIKQREGLKKHSDTDILVQRVLAFSLPPAGIALLVWMLYNSRGQYRFDGKTLEVPGHPPIDVAAISAVDRKLWDRKGIAIIEYATADGHIGRARLDDFVYERGPTDQIFDRVSSMFDELIEPGATAETSA
jgi:hypothetical protein